MTTHNPELRPPKPPPANATVQPDAPDFVETPDAVPSWSAGHEPLPLWIYLVCGLALFLAGSSFTGFGGTGLYDQGPGAPLLASAGGIEPPKPLDPMAVGKQVYSGNCANCHQASGEGQPGTYPPLVESEFVQGDKTRLEAILLHGLQGPVTVKGGTYGTALMPAWDTVLTDEKIADVITYIRASWGGTGDAVKPEDVSAARAKFAAQGENAYTQADLQKIAPSK